jgi:hypothetical protein
MAATRARLSRSFAVVMIQVVMRQCLMFSDLLFARDFPREPASLATLLLDGRFMPLYFSAIVAACAVPIAIVVALRNILAEGAAAFARDLLAFLAAVQVRLLPINYGMPIVDKTLLRVGAFGAKKPLSPGDEASASTRSCRPSSVVDRTFKGG